MQVDRIAPGLWRWTGQHPDWADGDDWPRDVGCTYYEAPGGVVLIDPLIPPEARDEFLAALDRDVERNGGTVTILLTVEWHARSTGELAGRYGAGVGTEVEGVEPVELDHAAQETVYWIPEHAALVVGDSILGGPELSPEHWLEDPSRYPAFLESVRALLDLPVERLLISHGEPILAGGRQRLAQLLQTK